ncbi:hypothetical protein F4677DRAFT_450654 [Hypoxylon crocopeplum]|nr:hypothetical protein F4677DRAFT_450654 [Hypoxylon crocopeplum]
MAGRKRSAFDHVDSFQSLTLLVLVLVGCVSTSPGVPDLFLLKLSVNKAGGGAVRVGYYGICASLEADTALSCTPSYSLGADQLTQTLFGKGNSTFTDSSIPALLAIARVIQTQICYPLLAGSAALFFISVVCMLLLKRTGKSTAVDVSAKMQCFQRWTMLMPQYALALALASAFSTTLAGGALNFATTTSLLSGAPTSEVIITAGLPVQALQWFIVALLDLYSWPVVSTFLEADSGGEAPGLPPPGPGGYPGPRPCHCCSEVFIEKVV